jgi:hypothetical protein
VGSVWLAFLCRKTLIAKTNWLKKKIIFDLGTFFMKGQSMGTGQANVKAYNRQLRNLINKDRAKPSWIVSHELALDGQVSKSLSIQGRRIQIQRKDVMSQAG